MIMDPSTEPVMQPEWLPEPRPKEPSYSARDYLDQVQQLSLVRTHISVFALGSVFLLVLNLLAGSASIWATTWIAAWVLIVVMHGIAAGIAGLVLQLLAEDDDIRPASEVRWSPAETWSPPPAESVESWDAPPTQPTAPSATPLSDQWKAPPPPPKDDERVSWKTASQVAWLAQTADTGHDHPGPHDTDAAPSTQASDHSRSV